MDSALSQEGDGVDKMSFFFLPKLFILYWRGFPGD